MDGEMIRTSHSMGSVLCVSCCWLGEVKDLCVSIPRDPFSKQMEQKPRELANSGSCGETEYLACGLSYV